MRLSDGTDAVVKHLQPFDDVEDELRGAHLLRWRDGIGAVRLFAVAGRQILQEYGGDKLLTHVLKEEGDDASSEIAAEVMARLHATSSRAVPPELQPLRRRFTSLFARAKPDLATDIPTIYVEAAELANGLLSDQRDAKPLHGDLHHDNILYGARGWLSIDPKGVFGDPAFDAANMFYNPLDRDNLCRNPERIASMGELFAKTLGQSPARLLDFAFAYGCLSAAWHAEDGDDAAEARELAIAEAIRSVRLSF